MSAVTDTPIQGNANAVDEPVVSVRSGAISTAPAHQGWGVVRGERGKNLAPPPVALVGIATLPVRIMTGADSGVAGPAGICPGAASKSVAPARYPMRDVTDVDPHGEAARILAAIVES